MQRWRTKTLRRHGLLILGIALLLFCLTPLVLGILAATKVPWNTEMIAVVWVAGILFLGIYAIYAIVRFVGARGRMEARFPNEPWHWQEDWAQKRAVDHQSLGIWAYTAVAALTNLLVGTGLHAMTLKQAEPALFIVVACFGVVGVGFSVAAFLAVLHTRKWGGSRLAFRNVPIGQDEPFVATIHAPASLTIDDQIALTISCQKRRERYTEILWSESIWVRSFLPSDQDGQVLIPVSVDIPEQCVGTNSSERVSWKLEARALRGMLPYQAEFEVPVFRLQSPRQRPDKSTYQSHLGKPNFQDALAMRGGSVLSDAPNRVEIRVSMVNRINTLLTLVAAPVIATLFCTGAYLFAAEGGVQGIVFGIIFGLLGTVLPLMAVAAALTTNHLTFDDAHVRRQRRMFGMSLTQNFELHEIDSFETHLMPATHGKHHQVKLRTIHGESHTMVDQITGSEMADAIADRFNEHIRRFHFGSTTSPSESKQARSSNPYDYRPTQTQGHSTESREIWSEV